jgi:hypothetical protein
VKNEEILHVFNAEISVLYAIGRRKVNWIGHILRRNFLLKRFIEGKIERNVERARRRGKRGKQLVYDIKEKNEGTGMLKLKR